MENSVYEIDTWLVIQILSFTYRCLFSLHVLSDELKFSNFESRFPILVLHFQNVWN